LEIITHRKQAARTNSLLRELLSFVVEASSPRLVSFHGSATGGISTPFKSTNDKFTTAPFNRNTVPATKNYKHAVFSTALNHIWVTEGVEASTWQSKDNVAANSRIRHPACRQPKPGWGTLMMIIAMMMMMMMMMMSSRAIFHVHSVP